MIETPISPESFEAYANEYDSVGFRYISKWDVDTAPVVGEILPISSTWDGDEPTDTKLAGTCAFDAWERVAEYAKYSKGTGWVVLIGGENKGHGDLAGELIIGSAKVLQVITW